MTVFILALLCSTVYSIELTLTQVDKDGLQHTAANSNVENIVAEGAKGEEFTPNSMKRKLDAEPCLTTTDSLVVTADLTNHALGVWDAKWRKETLEIDEITGQDTDRVLIKELDVTDSITLPAGAITGADIADGSIVGFQDILGNSVRGSNIQDESITGADIQDGSITGADIAPYSIIGYQKISAETITNTQLAENSVGSYAIADNSVKASAIDNSADITVGSISIPTSGKFTLGNGAPYHGNGVWWVYMNQAGFVNPGTVGRLDSSIFGDAIFSVRSAGSIFSNGYFIASDSRIKESIVPVPDNLALVTIRKLDAKYYNYKDTLDRGKNRTIGFIAQEVLQHIPEAVKITSKFIPNEMRAVNVTWTKLSSTGYRMKLNNDHLEPGKYRFYMSNQTKLETGTMKELLTTDGQTFEVDQNFENVFLYGKEVHDFLTLSKDKIWAVAYAALQQVDKNQQILQQNVSTLAKTIAALSARLAILESN